MGATGRTKEGSRTGVWLLRDDLINCPKERAKPGCGWLALGVVNGALVTGFGPGR